MPVTTALVCNSEPEERIELGTVDDEELTLVVKSHGVVATIVCSMGELDRFTDIVRTVAMDRGSK